MSIKTPAQLFSFPAQDFNGTMVDEGEARKNVTHLDKERTF